MPNSEPKPPKSKDHPKTLRVLLVEDNPLDAELTFLELKRAGFDVIGDVVKTREEYFDRLRSKSYDVVLSDHNLGDWTGIDALEILVQQGKNLPFILVTGSMGEESAVESIKMGAADYVLKDRLARLHVAVRRALEERAAREERLQAAETIRRNEEKYRALFENANDFIYTTDLQGNLTSINQAGERILGFRREELLGKNLVEMFSFDKLDEFLQVMANQLSGNEVHYYERRITTKDGRKVTLEISTRLIRDANGEPEGTQGIARDITERELLQAQLQQSQKMEGIGRLAGGVAHDFNNHLGIILGYSEMLLEKLGSDNPLRKRVETIFATAQKAASLTKQLLAFSRRQVFEPRIVDLNADVLELKKMLHPLLGEDIEVVTALDPALGKVRVDSSQINQVLMNLAVNARDAMPQGGRIIIETKNVDLDKDYASGHIMVQPGRHVMLAVSDTGKGMSKEVQSHIFEPFYTTKEKGKGTGLGLAMVYGVVKQSGGSIWVYSEPGQGTTFKIYFPRLASDDLAPGEEKTSSLIQRGAGIVLVAEDEPVLLGLTREFLTDSGYEILAAQNGAEAIEISKIYKGRIHLLITDAIMPGMSGRELAVQMQGLRPDIKVLYVSGYTDDVVLRSGMVGSEMDFLQKPFTRDQLLQKVRKVMGVEE